jgi:glucosamine--fructose-6-phosphate aminotransferase (isomerizing)
MCGIVGYLGHREAFNIILKGLQRLEYHGSINKNVFMIRKGK